MATWLVVALHLLVVFAFLDKRYWALIWRLPPIPWSFASLSEDFAFWAPAWLIWLMLLYPVLATSLIVILAISLIWSVIVATPPRSYGLFQTVLVTICTANLFLLLPASHCLGSFST